VLEVPEMQKAMRCVLLCMLEAVKDELCLLEMLEFAKGDALCAALCAGVCERWALFAGGVGGAGGDTLRAALYAGGYERWALSASSIRGVRQNSFMLHLCSSCLPEISLQTLPDSSEIPY
jgi:hypothetical protein